MKKAVLLFGGTTEGRALFDFCRQNGIPVTLSVATDYGTLGLQENKNAVIHAGRLEETEMEELLQSGQFSLVIDATHPYAKQVTANLRQACKAAKIPCLRLLREEGDQSGAMVFDSAQLAADFLAETEGNILLTTGSREISAFGALNREGSRVFARVLPVEESIGACRQAGICGRNLLCMQGPFSADFTYAILKEFQCRYLVTKNSGAPGGFSEKIEAARRAGAKVLVIRRPQEDGLSFEQVRAYLWDWMAREEGKGR
ncbi:MAG: precorrin-6A reductase [Oscillospiraceae bacterium]|nr:precorrin-6A reductase [Oscillospiraceae bacterium]